MRKSLVAVILLLGLALGGVCGTVSAVNGADEAVKITETVVLGDRSVLDGLELTLVTQSANHLLWTTECTFTGELKTGTEFEFSRNRLNWIREATPNGIDIFLCSSGFGYSTSGNGDGMDLEEEARIEQELMWAPVLDVAQRAPAGQTYTEQAELSDYYDYYPLYTDWNGDYRNIDEPDALSKLLTDFFRIPVEEGQMVEVSIEKDEAGRIWEVNMNALDAEQIFYTRSVAVEGGTYFTLSSYTEEWVEDGVYNRTPVEIYRPDGSLADVGLWYLPEMANESDPVAPKLVYQLGQADVQGMALSADEKQLLLIIREDGMETLLVIDLATMTPVQKIPLFEVITEEENWQEFRDLTVQPDFLIVRDSNRGFILLEAQGDGAYVERIRGDLDPVEDWDRALIYNDPVMAWDGERLAVASWMDLRNYKDTCSFYLAVYDSSGLRCAAEYANSQDVGQPDNWNDQCKPADVDGMTLRWVK